jgi:hypothetical protein
MRVIAVGSVKLDAAGMPPGRRRAKGPIRERRRTFANGCA